MAAASVHVMNLPDDVYLAQTAAHAVAYQRRHRRGRAIGELAELVARVVGFEGRIVFDTSKPDGTPRKLLDVGRLHATGWRARTGLEEGLNRTYEWYLVNPHRGKSHAGTGSAPADHFKLTILHRCEYPRIRAGLVRAMEYDYRRVNLVITVYCPAAICGESG